MKINGNSIDLPGWSWTVITSVGRLGSLGPTSFTAITRNETFSPSFKFGIVYEWSRAGKSATSVQSRLHRKKIVLIRIIYPQTYRVIVFQ
jgi:hypothetical protein